MLRVLSILILTAAAAIGTAEEPVIGGPCDGCENVYVGMPDELSVLGRISADDEPGEPMVISGIVVDDSGPVGGVIVYAYQTDAGGIYPRAETRHGRLRAWAVTDAVGHYAFHTVRPGAYPGRKIAQHVHMHVIEPGVGTYYIDDVVFTDDPLLTPKQRARRHDRGGSGVVTPERDRDGTWLVTRDIFLGKNIPGYPGD